MFYDLVSPFNRYMIDGSNVYMLKEENQYSKY